MADISKIQLPNGTTYDIKDASAVHDHMVILSYGNSTWQDFIDAYDTNTVVYCRASSNSNPATGSQTRLAFMAYVNNATTPTNVEFQYYRSVNSHSISQQGDQVFVYKLDKTNGWSVITREASSKIVAGNGLSSAYTKDTVTLAADVLSVNGQTGAVVLDADDVGALPDTTVIPAKTSDLTNDSGFITSSDIPVTSVNNKTGAVTITAEDLGLSQALKFIGVSSTEITDGGTEEPTIPGYTGTAKTIGNVVIYGNLEFVWSGSAWEQLGDDRSFVIANPTITAGTATKITYDAKGLVTAGASLDSTDVTTALGYTPYNSTNPSGYITSSALTNYMQKGVDYVTAGQLSGTTLGTNATAEGYRTTASGDYSHAEGVLTTASGDYSHAEGDNTVAYYASHAEGYGTTAEGSYSHAEGEKSAAFGTASHAENFSSAYGLYSHSEGHAGTDLTSLTQSMRGAIGDYSHSEGLGTTANRKSQHVFGEYNIVDTFGESNTARGKYVEIVGNGSDASSPVTLSNARTLDWDGNEVLAGKLTVGAGPTNNMDVATKQYVDNSIPVTSNFMVKGVDYVTAGRKSGTTLGTYATAEGLDTTASNSQSHAEGWLTTANAQNSHAEGNNTVAANTSAHAEGSYSESRGVASHSEGYYSYAGGNYAHAEGSSTTASGENAHSEGGSTTASGADSHAEGTSTEASGVAAHAEGANTTAIGGSSHAEGFYTTTTATASHAEGYDTTASGNHSHAEGYKTTAQSKSQHVFGEYNIVDTSGDTSSRGTYVEIVGNGTADDAKSNARTLDWSGNETLAGNITIGNSATMQYNSTDKSIDFVFI